MKLPQNAAEIEELLKAYKLPVALGGASLVSILLSLGLLFKSSVNTDPVEIIDSTEQVAGESTRRTIKVDVGGAVREPGVYELEIGARIDDAITKAGGLTDQANEEVVEKTINKAQKLSDGMKLYIPSISDAAKGNTYEASSTSHNIYSLETGNLISVNSASQSKLESLPGVGPVTAKKIIDNRPYMATDELVTKKVVGNSLFEKIKNQLSL